ncbi:hypothetical protein [Kitasatospora sp. NA04385]|uniref:hypothetical protein n=1 Tax=Kitasatospora sp. NA04385 TaxID=2742135 RepID=UPI0020CAD166|nr:hypothetical protein [Kitasatospora sp. NA04385]
MRICMVAPSLVGLGVVGAQHQLGEVPHHLLALALRPVDGPLRDGLHRLPRAHHLLDLCLQGVQTGAVGDRVLQRVLVVVHPDLLQQGGFLGHHDLRPGPGQTVLHLEQVLPGLLQFLPCLACFLEEGLHLGGLSAYCIAGLEAKFAGVLFPPSTSAEELGASTPIFDARW